MRCEEKHAYPSERKALDYAKRRMRDNRTLELRAYRCQHCGRWHLTHVPDRFQKEAS
jgi:hypothetical protein